MITIADQESAASAKYELESAWLGAESWQLLVGGVPVLTLSRQNCELSVEWGKLIFAWWDQDYSQSWRILAYEIVGSEVRFRATRGLVRETTVLVLRDQRGEPALPEVENLDQTERRRRYGPWLAKLLSAKVEGARVRRVTVGADRARSLPGRYARLSVRLGRETIFVIGVNGAESQPEIDAILTAGLAWLAGANQDRDSKRRAQRLWFCLPAGRARTALERLTLIETSHLEAQIECFEVDERRSELIRVPPSTQGELFSQHPRELKWPADSIAGGEWRDRIMNLAPGLIEARPRPGHRGESFFINGLEFARVVPGERLEVKFGVASQGAEIRPEPTFPLDEANFVELQSLVREIATYRSSDSPDRRHPFYRWRAESWLESLLRRDICALDSTLDARYVYSQIPAWREDERSVIDLLTIDREARLVIIELKVAEDSQLPLQGLDYWLRVEQARLCGEFERRGLFAGLRIADQSPRLYLVAPRLRFHRTFAAVANCLGSPIEASQIGINTNWREGVRIHSRERINEKRQI